jgi:hypothetical protein
LMEVRQLGLPATVDQSKYDTKIKAWPDGLVAQHTGLEGLCRGGASPRNFLAESLS